MRPDDLTALVVRTVLATLPELDPQSVEDLMVAADSRRRVGIQRRTRRRTARGPAQCAGVTVNRYCSSSLQTIRMAAHAIRAGEGDVFVAAGVETVSRFASGASDSGKPPMNSSPTP